jgi:hypothetical protein
MFPGQLGAGGVGVGGRNRGGGGEGFCGLHPDILAKRRKKGEKGSEAHSSISEG